MSIMTINSILRRSCRPASAVAFAVTAAAAALLSNSNALAFEGVKELLPVLARPSLGDFLKEGLLFEYFAASELSAPHPGVLINSEFRQALSDAAAVKALTGVDFGQVTGVLATGLPGSDRLAISGKAGFADGMKVALSARGFKQSSAGAFQLFALGVESEPKLTLPGSGDPFAPMSGVQRLLVSPTRVVSLRSDAAVSDAPIWFAENSVCQPCVLSDALFEATDAAAGKGARLVQAVGASLLTFPSSGIDPAEFLTNPDGTMPTPDELKAKLAAKSTAPVQPPFVAAMLSLTATGETNSVHIALAYPSAEARDKGAPIAAQRLSERISIRVPLPGRAPPKSVAIAKSQSGDWAIAVLSPEFDGATPDKVKAEFRLWMQTLIQSDFFPLASAY